jgi:hypothetical protein
VGVDYLRFSISLTTESAASTTIDAMHSIRIGFMGSSSLQPAHGGISSIGPDHEVVDGAWNWSEEGPQNAEDDYPSCPAISLSLEMGWLPIRTWFVHGPVPPLDLDKGLSLWRDPLTLKYNLILRGYDIDQASVRVWP